MIDKAHVNEEDDLASRESLGPIRAVSRSIAVLRALNRSGPMTVAQIADSARIPYPTAYRILHALIHEGLIERDGPRKLYRPTALVQSLAHGYQEHSRLTHVARPYLVDFTARTLWPTMVATPLGRSMIIRDATYALAPMTLDYFYPGYAFSMIDSAVGRVCLAFFEPEERERRLRAIEASGAAVEGWVLDGFRSGALAQDIRQRGYASRPRNRLSNPPGRTSSIAAPIFSQGRVAAGVAVVMIASAVRLADAESRYADDLIAMAREISRKLDERGSA